MDDNERGRDTNADATGDAGADADGGLDVSRRTVLEGAGAATGLALAAGEVAGADAAEPDGDDEPRATGPAFEEREWGYVRSDFEPPEGPDVPVVLAMDGYGRSEPATHYLRMRDGVHIAVQMENANLVRGGPLEDDYLTVSASLRGTGCSGGTFDLFDRTGARDGRELIEWLADRPWSLDRVGLLGGSYSGISAFLIASTRPPSLGAMSASMVVGDLYRGIAYPGGVPNSGFPGAWTAGIRPGLAASGTATGTAGQDPICAGNVAGREPVHPASEDTSALYSHRRADTMYYVRSILSYADRIAVPTYVSHAWQDEQTGPRGGPAVFEAISPDPASPPGAPGPTPGADHPAAGRGPPTDAPRHEEPKLFRATNGHHADASDVAVTEVRDWFDYWLLGEETGIMDTPRARLHVGTGTADSQGTLGLDGFPPSDADWARYRFHADGAARRESPTEAGTDAYITGSPRQSWAFSDGMAQPVTDASGAATLAEAPDVAVYRTPAFDRPRAVAGPMAARLFVESSVAEFDLFVTVADEYPDGTLVPLQRGMLRASHRSLDEARSDRTPDGEVYRPHHPHTNPQPVTPGDVNRYDVEVWPLGHLVYPGHRLVFVVGSPPAADGTYAYEQSTAKGVNRIHRGPDRQSRLLVPLVDWEGPTPPEPAPTEPTGYRTG